MLENLRLFEKSNKLYQQGTRGNKSVCKLRGQWGEKRGDFFNLLFAVPFQYINRHLKSSFLSFDLNHTSKQRVHIREVTLQGREFCLKRAINYKGRGHRTVFQASLAVRWKVLFCSFIVYSRSSMHSVGCDFYSKKLILVQTNDCKI